jgi:hypothetical protein
VWYVLQPILSILVVNQGLRLPAYLENTVLSQEPKFGQIQCIILKCELPAADSGGADAVVFAVQQ